MVENSAAITSFYNIELEFFCIILLRKEFTQLGKCNSAIYELMLLLEAALLALILTQLLKSFFASTRASTFHVNSITAEWNVQFCEFTTLSGRQLKTVRFLLFQLSSASQFHGYLCRNICNATGNFTVYSDRNVISYLLSTCKLKSSGVENFV